MQQIIFVSTNHLLIAVILQILKQAHIIVYALLSHERFIKNMEMAEMYGVFCIDLAIPSELLTPLLTIAAKYPEVFTLVFLGDSSSLSVSALEAINHLSFPIFPLPLDEQAFLTTIQDLLSRFPSRNH